MNIYSIKNEKLSFFNRPIYCESFNEALSYIQNILMSDADRALLGLRDDLALYWLGTIDFVSGVIKSPKEPKFVTGLVDIFNSIPEDKIPQTAKALSDRIIKLSEEIEKIKNERSIDYVSCEIVSTDERT